MVKVSQLFKRVESDTSLSTVQAALKRRLLEARPEEADPAIIEHLASAVSAASQAEKNEMDVANARKLSRWVWTPIVVSVLAVIGTLGGLWFQYTQFRAQASAAERTQVEGQWRAAITKLYDSDPVKAAGGAFLLHSFLAPLPSDTKHQTLSPTQEHFQGEAYRVATHFMGTTVHGAVFKILSADVCEATTPDNMGFLAETIRMQAEARRDVEGQSGQISPGNISGPLASRTVPREEVLAMIDEQIVAFSQCYTDVVRGYNWDDLTIANIELRHGDLSNLTASKLTLTRAHFVSCSLVDADLCGAVDIDETVWTGSKWWQAARIGEPLLKHLAEKYPFPNQTDDSRTAYDQGLKRLQSAACK